MKSKQVLPVMTNELAERIDDVNVAYTISRVESIGEEPGNPSGAGVQKFGSSIALKVRALPFIPWMNAVLKFGPEDLSQFQEILSFYEDDHIEPSFWISPFSFDEEMAATLAESGFFPAHFEQATLYGVPEDVEPEPADDVTVELATADTLEDYLLAFLEGFGFPEKYWEGARRNMRHWLGREGFHLYLVRFEGEPAGASALFVKDGIGLLASGSVRPAMRGKGCHSAMIQQRLFDSGRLGGELVAGGAYFGTTSFRNQQKAGLRNAFLQTTWKRKQG
ncbi:MAG: hypothetical protein QF437_18385 [Planctomycetota bacterium]|nr:hypothetical protein [Planctomycetota bacterium]